MALTGRLLVDLAEHSSQRPSTAHRIADVGVVVSENIAVASPDSMKVRVRPILFRKPPPMLHVNDPGINSLEQPALLFNSSAGGFNLHPIA